MDTPKVSLQGVHKSFGSQHVLRGVDLDVAQGESVVIIGGSGTGKSVTLKNICGLIWPDRGRVFFDGKDITFTPELEMTAIRMKIGMLFQNAALFDSLPVWENIAFALLEHRLATKSEVMDIVAETLRMVGLPGVEYKMPSELSGGMRKRVGLARAIAMKPEVMLYDEPTTGLDPIMSDVINELIISTADTLGVTSISVTHDLKSAAKIADRIVMLYKGRIYASGTATEILESEDPVVRQFVRGEAEGPITAALK
ncbi:MAG: ATP-binding cassette domain-containing protein [Planctomycetota bacterium]